MTEPSREAPNGRPPAGLLTLTAPRRGKPPGHLADLDLAGRRAVLAELGQPAYRAKQLSGHYFERGFDAARDDAAALSDVPVAARQPLIDALFPALLTPVREVTCDRGETRKTLWRLHDGSLVESVLMHYPDRTTLCVSSQAGCGMNCPFCATGQAGLTRNLSTAEIVGQVVAGNRTCREAGRGPIGNVVFMGMGEALANYKATLAALHRLIDPAPEGLGMSARGVTMSTVGLVPAVDKLAAAGLPVTLALSLHAPDDDLRDELVPLNTRHSVAAVLDSARRYFDATGRRVSIEYALIHEVNDQTWRADRLGTELNRRGRGWVHVNPIPLNPTPGSRWTASSAKAQREFVARLRAHHIPTTVRDTRGREIDGACGQLAAAGPAEVRPAGPKRLAESEP